jgi:hypothetical protein
MSPESRCRSSTIGEEREIRLKQEFCVIVRLVSSVGIAALLSLASTPASAHCDTMDGPVVAAARAALQTGEVTPVLKWIPKQSEPEIRAAFARTLKVRASSAEAKELADTYFFETLVRIHRSGEGEPYTGLRPVGTQIEPAIAAADRALLKGPADPLVRLMTEQVAAGIRQRFDRAARAGKSADASESAGREYVEAYVDLMRYLEQLGQAGRGSETDKR